MSNPKRVEVCKSFSFDSSHQLVGHCGKCSNLHGHTYKLEVAVKGPLKLHPRNMLDSLFQVEDEVLHAEYLNTVSNEGFVVDFYDLKMLVGKHIVDQFDHAFLAQGNEPVLKSVLESDLKVVELGFRTTVEHMSAYILWKLANVGVPVSSVRLWETPTGWAETKIEDIDVDRDLDFFTHTTPRS